MQFRVTTDHFRDKRETIAAVHAVKAPVGATYIIGMLKVDLFDEHSLAPDA